MAFDATLHTEHTEDVDHAGCGTARRARVWEADDDDELPDYAPRRKANRERRGTTHAGRTPPPRSPERSPERGWRGPTRATRRGTEEFKCRHCRAFIGPTVGGGRHRNHCPCCLHSRHVDDRRPGDRASVCGATMAPVARFDRPGGEPVLVHRCLGCGLERHNRLAADDNLALLIRLPLVAPRVGQRTPADAATTAVAGLTRRRVS